MKKLLVACMLVFFAGIGTTFAITLKGTITDPKNNNKKLENIQVKIGDKTETTDESGKFEIFGFQPSGRMNITFKDRENPARFERIEGVLQGFPNDPKFGEKSLEIEKDQDQNITAYVLNIAMEPIPTDEVISGVVVGEYKNPLGNIMITGSVEVTEDGKTKTKSLSQYNKEITTDEEGNFTILGDKEKGGEYQLFFKDNQNRYKKKDEKVSLGAGETKTNYEVELTEKTAEQISEEQLEEMTNFECNKLMPKYLVGANCTEKSNLQGTAEDLTSWIQVIGNKITSVVGVIAVGLIVWNGFLISTSAGDSDRVGRGKKGIIWTIVGLALIMGAYLIVKAVIMLTYSA